MPSPGHWCGAVRASCVEVAGRLGLTARGGRLSACPVCQSPKHGSGRLYLGRDGRQRWHCFRCETGGDAIDLAALSLCGGRLRELTPEAKHDVRRWFEQQGLLH